MSKTESFVVDYNTPVKEPVFDYGEPTDYPADLYQVRGLLSGVKRFADVTAEQIASFHEQGYLVVHQAFSPAEVQGALAGLLYLLSGQHPTFTGVMYEKKAKGVNVEGLSAEARQDYVRKFMWFVEYENRLKAIAYHPDLLRVTTQLIGAQPALYQDMALIKPPRIGREKPWHQDHAYFDLPLGTPVVGVWIALDEATVDNGCMVIYPGSHRQGPVVHFQRRDWQICDTHDRNGGAHAVPLQPGACSFSTACSTTAHRPIRQPSAAAPSSFITPRLKRQRPPKKNGWRSLAPRAKTLPVSGEWQVASCDLLVVTDSTL